MHCEHCGTELKRLHQTASGGMLYVCPYCKRYHEEKRATVSLIVHALDDLRLVMDKGDCDKAYAYMERLADELFTDASYDIIEDTCKKLSEDAGRCCSEV